MKCSVLPLLLLPGAIAFELPFKVSKLFSSTAAAASEKPAVVATPRVAIIGAGAGGSSAAFWISKAKERYGFDVEVDVYEASNYIGGRKSSCFGPDETL